jgi:hypothetical protein
VNVSVKLCFYNPSIVILYTVAPGKKPSTGAEGFYLYLTYDDFDEGVP